MKTLVLLPQPLPLPEYTVLGPISEVAGDGTEGYYIDESDPRYDWEECPQGSEHKG